MIKQIIIFALIVLLDLSVPSFEATFDSLETGEFMYDYFFRNIFVAYLIGLAVEHVLYLSLKNYITVKPWFRFMFQLVVSLIVESLMMLQLLALMSV